MRTHTDDPESYYFLASPQTSFGTNEPQRTSAGRLTTFGLDVGPSDPNNNGPELGFPDTNIYLLFLIFFRFQAYYVVLYLKASISFKLIFS